MSPSIPARYHGLWRAENDRLVVGLVLEGPAAPRALIWAGEKVRLDTSEMSWTPHTQEDSRITTHRLDTLTLEFDAPIGPTYSLMFSVENQEPERFGGFQWIRPLPDSPLEHLRLHPQYGASDTAAMVGYWDDLAIDERSWLEAWFLPYSIFRLVHPSEAAAHPQWSALIAETPGSTTSPGGA